MPDLLLVFRNHQTLFQEEKNKSLNLQKIFDYAKQLTKQGKSINRLSSGAEQGRSESGGINQEATVITSAIYDANRRNEGTEKELSQKEVRDKQEEALERFAKENGFWIEPGTYGKSDYHGGEQLVYDNRDGTVTKINNGNMHPNDWTELFDRIAIHNQINPNDKIIIKGFTKHKFPNKSNFTEESFGVVLEQPFIKKSGEDITYDELVEDQRKRGFELIPEDENGGGATEYDFRNKELGLLSLDNHGENVIRDENGVIHYIDSVITLDSDSKGFEGTNEINEDYLQDDTGEKIYKQLPSDEKRGSNEGSARNDKAPNDIRAVSGTVQSEQGKPKRVLDKQEQNGNIKGAANIETQQTFYGKQADISTAIHEPSHHFLGLIDTLASQGNAKAIAMQRTVNQWTESKEGKAFAEREGLEQNSPIHRQELFARSAEKYFTEGKRAGFSERMNKVFEAFKTYLKDIYEGVVNSPYKIELSPEIRDLFDTIYGKEKTNEDLGKDKAEIIEEKTGEEIEKKANELTAKSSDSLLKQQKENLLKDLNDIEDILLGEDGILEKNRISELDIPNDRKSDLISGLTNNIDFKEKKNELKKAGFIVVGDAVKVPIYKDGEVTIGNIRYAMQSVMEDFPTKTEVKISTYRKTTPSLVGMGKYDTLENSKQSLQTASDNLEQAKKDKNKGLIETYDKQLKIEKANYQSALSEYESKKREIKDTEENIKEGEFNSIYDIERLLNLPLLKQEVATFEGKDISLKEPDYKLAKKELSKIIDNAEKELVDYTEKYRKKDGGLKSNIPIAIDNSIRRQEDNIKQLQEKLDSVEQKLKPEPKVDEIETKINEIAKKFKSVESELKGDIDVKEFSTRLKKRYDEIKEQYGEDKANEVLDSEAKRADKIIKEHRDSIAQRLKAEYFKKNGNAPSSIRDFKSGIKSGEYKIDDLPSYEDGINAGLEIPKEPKVFLQPTNDETPEESLSIKEQLKQAREIRDRLRALNIENPPVPPVVEEDKIEEVTTPPSGITHAATAETREEFGFGEYEKEIITDIELNRKADEEIRNGYNIEKLLKKLERGDIPTSLETVILKKYKVVLDAKVSADPTNENIEELRRLVEVSDKSRSDIGRALRAGRGDVDVEETLGDYFIREMEASKVNELTDAQKIQIKEEFDNITKAKAELENKLAELEDENTRLKALIEVRNLKSNSKKSNKSPEDYKLEREKIKQDIANKWKEAGKGNNMLTSVIIPLPFGKIKQLATVAPDVKKLVKNYVEEGIDNLNSIIDNIHSILADEIDGITKNDIRDIIAGNYDEPKKTRAEIQTTIMDLKTEAKLLSQIDRLENGEQPVSEGGKKVRNQRTKELRDKVRELKQSTGGVNTSNIESSKLQGVKNRLEKEIEKLEEELKTGNFESVKNQNQLN